MELAGKGVEEPGRDHFLHNLEDSGADVVSCSEKGRKTLESLSRRRPWSVLHFRSIAVAIVQTTDCVKRGQGRKQGGHLGSDFRDQLRSDGRLE